MNKLIPIVPLALAILTACSPPREKIPPLPEPAVRGNKLVIYQLMTRLFGNTVDLNKPFGTIAENGTGKMEDIDVSALKGIRGMGVTHVWYTGIIEHAQLTDYSSYGIAKDDADVVKGRAGSPYAIKDYYDIDPDLAVDVRNRMMEFERLVSRTHEAGMKVIIDFVPNHVARAYHSDAKPEGVSDLGEKDDRTAAFSAANNFYYIPGKAFEVPRNSTWLKGIDADRFDGKFDESPAKATGNDVFQPSPSAGDWYETVKLNYGVDYVHGGEKSFEPIPDAWIKMKDILAFWAGKKVDGFRCDMVQMVPVEFWEWVIPQIKAIQPDLIFIAEIYVPSLYRSYLDAGHFDYLYDKVQLYDTLRLMVNGKVGSPSIPRIRKSWSDIQSHLVHFLENHDEQRIASAQFAGDPWKALPAMVVSTLIDAGPAMIYFGQEVGEPGKGAEGYQGDDGRTTIYDYWGVPEFQKWVNAKKYDGSGLSDDQRQLRQYYGDLLKLAGENEAISKGSYADLTAYNVAAHNCSPQIVAFVRASADERLIVIAGFNTKIEHAKIVLPPEAVKTLGLQSNEDYVGRDLLRSGLDIGLSKDYSFELDIPPFTSFILKIK